MTQDNESLVTRMWDAIWLDGAVDTLDELLADPFVRHTRDGTNSMSLASYASHLADVLQTIRGIKVTVLHIASVDDMVYARIHLDALNLETAKKLDLTWLTQYRIADGRIAESWTMHLNDLDW